MSNVTLTQLFACTAEGGAFVAEAADGKMVHISTVPSGLVCQCSCAGCNRRMVAKKGPKQEHHFAHFGTNSDRPCVSAGETALHKYAKQLLDAALEIELPGMEVMDGEVRETVVRQQRLKFDRAILEKKEGSIVPDVVLLLGDRRLIVEFKVTHASDEQKIARITTMDAGAVEIDLSKFRDRSLDNIHDLILFSAPRKWLHNPLKPAALIRAKEKSRIREENTAAEIRRLSDLYVHRLPAEKNNIGRSEGFARCEGLEDCINLAVDGAGCFSVPVVEWQSAILLQLIASDSKPFRTRNALALVRNKRFLDRCFENVTDEIGTEVKKFCPNFATPYSAIESYLYLLEQHGFVRRGQTEQWELSYILQSKISGAKELRDRPEKRLAKVRAIVVLTVDSLPEDELVSFDFNRWSREKLPCRNYSVADAIHFDKREWNSFYEEMYNLSTMLRFSARSGMNLLGLPLEAKLQRALEVKREEEEKRDRTNYEQLAADGDRRVSDLRIRAATKIGQDGERWLNTANNEIEGRSPIEAARSGDEGFRAASQILARRHGDIQNAAKTKFRKQAAVNLLQSEAQKRYYTLEAADLWMSSSQPHLGKSPQDFCIDERTREVCLRYLPAKKSRH